MVKILPANAGDINDAGSFPGSGPSPGGGQGNPLQYSCLENPTERGAWWATISGVTSVVSNSETLWTVARQASLSVGFSRQEYWSRLPCPPPENLSDPGMETASLTYPALAGRFFIMLFFFK